SAEKKRRTKLPAKGAGSFVCGLEQTLVKLASGSGVSVAAEQSKVDEGADTDGERDEREGRNSPSFRVAAYAGDDAEGGEEADRSRDEQDAGAARTCWLI